MAVDSKRLVLSLVGRRTKLSTTHWGRRAVQGRKALYSGGGLGGGVGSGGMGGTQFVP